MSIEKFRSVEEMPRPKPVPPGSPDLARRIASLWRASTLMADYHPRRGLQFFRSLEEAAAERSLRRTLRMRRRAKELGFLPPDAPDLP
ncbi:MAG TPA: hypothetical protein VGO93_30865 [Candidatus Xenobia bacterium]|jgi:hypothetical protein